MKKKLNELKKQYETTNDELNVLKANGNLSKLCNLRTEFDTTFDSFFDKKELRKKYNDEESVLSITELEEMLDDADLRGLIKFYENYIERLKDEINELKG